MDGLVQFMGFLALGTTVLAIMLGFGRKYYNEEQNAKAKKTPLSKC